MHSILSRFPMKRRFAQEIKTYQYCDNILTEFSLRFISDSSSFSFLKPTKFEYAVSFQHIPWDPDIFKGMTS